MSKQIPLTQGKFAIVDDNDFEYLNQWKWRCHNGYAARQHLDKWFFMHRVIIQTPKGKQTDHINHDRLDDRKENLRICTWAENQHNAKLRKDNTSGYKGVNMYKKTKKWRAQVKINGIMLYFGTYPSPEAAARAYDIAAKKLFGEFALTNF